MIKKIPKFFFLNLKNLAKLNISLNLIEKLDGSVGKLKKLKFLDLSFNNLKLIPFTLVDLEYLEEFNLDWFGYVENSFYQTKINKKILIKRFFFEMNKVKFEIERNSEVTIEYLTLDFFFNFFTKEKISNPISKIFEAVENESINIIDFLAQKLNLGENIKTLKNEENLTLFDLAIIEKKRRSIIFLIEKWGFFGSNISIYGHTLHLAVRNLDIPLIEYLIRNGVDPNISDFKGNNSLHVLFYVLGLENFESSYKIFKILIENG